MSDSPVSVCVVERGNDYSVLVKFGPADALSIDGLSLEVAQSCAVDLSSKLMDKFMSIFSENIGRFMPDSKTDTDTASIIASLISRQK